MKAAVLGYPIEHSLSPYLHLLLSQGCGIEMEYNKFPTEKNTLEKTVELLKNENYIGFNCTMPLKYEMYKMCSELSDESKFLRSVNTVKIKNGKFCGSTTDGMGMLTCVKKLVGNVKNKKVIILGTGGTARSIAYSFKEGGAKISVVNRSVGIMGEMFPDIDFFGFESLDKLSESADILINATPLGMTGFDGFSDLSFIKNMKKTAVICDAVYNPLETKLLKSARNCGLMTVDGLSMLVYQGVYSFNLWTDVFPSDETVKKTYDILKGENL